MPKKESIICLPYFLEATRAFSAAAQERIQRLSQRDGLMSQIKRHAVFEGRRSSIKQPDQSVRESAMQEFSAEFSISDEDMHRLDRNVVEKAISSMASQFGQKTARHLIDTMHEITTETGNVFDGGGKPLSNEMLHDVLSKLPALSDPTGDSGYTLVVHPDMTDRIKTLQAEYESSPELQRKHRDLQVQKFEEFRSNQLARKLVG